MCVSISGSVARSKSWGTGQSPDRRKRRGKFSSSQWFGAHKNGIADTLHHWKKRASNPAMSIPISAFQWVDEETSSPLVNIIEIGDIGVSDAHRRAYQRFWATPELICSRPAFPRSVYRRRAYPLFSRSTAILTRGRGHGTT